MRDPHNREGRAGLPKGPPLFPVKIDGKEPYQVKAITSLFFYVRKLLFPGGAALPPANPAISEPVFPTRRTFPFLRFPAPFYSYIYYYLTNQLGQTLLFFFLWCDVVESEF